MAGLNFIKKDGENIFDMMEGLDMDAMFTFVKRLPEGTPVNVVLLSDEKYALVKEALTPKEKTVDQMRKYFHGPVLDFFCKIHSDSYGVNLSKELAKDYLKTQCLGLIEDESYEFWNEFLDIANQTQSVNSWLKFKKGQEKSNIKLSPKHTADLTYIDYREFIDRIGLLLQDRYDNAALPDVIEY